PTLLLMVLITATAFTLAVRLEAMVVAILGMAGGFLTPVLLSTGEDHPVGLFTYIALLAAGLIAVALARRWHFVIALAAPGLRGTVVLGADLCLLVLTLREPRLAPLQLLGGALAHLFVAAWAVGNLSDALLFWGLGLVLVFAVLHSLFPVLLQRLRPNVAPVWWSHLFPPLALMLMLIPLFTLATVSILFWPVI